MHSKPLGVLFVYFGDRVSFGISAGLKFALWTMVSHLQQSSCFCLQCCSSKPVSPYPDCGGL